MPTTPQEAFTIIDVINKYVPFKTAKKLMAELNDKVGKHSENRSVKMTLQMLADLYTLNTEEAFDKWRLLAQQLGYSHSEVGLDAVTPH